MMSWFLGVIIVILVILLFNDRRKTKIISLKLQNILSENSTERIKVNNLNKEKQILVKYINNLLDKYQSIYVDNKNYKEQHKKMISNISHDIRTPLTAIMGYIDLLMDDTLEENKKEEYIRIIYERGNALKKLIDEFFEMAKLECNDIEMNIEKVNISEVIRQDIITFMNEITAREIVPEINMGDKEIFVLADKNALHRVITNLISNSLKYGHEGKIIGVELNLHQEFVKMSIYDRGKGIEKSQISQIFNRLYTQEKSRNRKLQGSGLGLTIVKKLVEDMNGSIEVQSIPYDKTSFTITLPRAN